MRIPLHLQSVSWMYFRPIILTSHLVM